MTTDNQSAYVTCWPPNGPPSKLDFILVNGSFVQETCQVGVVADATLPTHIPIFLDTPTRIRDLEVITLPRQLPRRTGPGDETYPGLIQMSNTFQRQVIEARLDDAYLGWSQGGLPMLCCKVNHKGFTWERH